MTLPTISVITPSFNQARYLERTLQSVLGQAYPHLEYIVVDGGSTDGSTDIIRRYESQLAYWRSEPDGGQTDALIKGFARATGEIQCWLNSDDLFEPWTLREVANFFRGASHARVVYGDAIWIDEEDRPIRPKKEHAFSRFIWMYDHNYIPQPSTFWSGDLYRQVGGLDRQYDLAMDADLWVRFGEVTPLHHVGRVWSRMRFHAAQKMQRLQAKAREEDLRIRRRYVGDQPAYARKAKKAVAKGLRVARKLVAGCYW